MVDWSGAARRRAGRIGHDLDRIWTGNCRSRLLVLILGPKRRVIDSILDKTMRSKQRILLCFDFAYGYPVDFAAALQAATGKSDRDLPWVTLWQYLSEHVKDDEGTAPGAKPSNRSNRFEVANRINALLSTAPDAAGPFWSASPASAYPYIPQRRPPEPFQTAQGYVVKGLRLTD